MEPGMKRPIDSNLYFQVLLGIALGVIFGFVSPVRAAEMRPLGDGFIKLVNTLPVEHQGPVGHPATAAEAQGRLTL